ncbi:MAG: AbrB/MazE/SpoVT family DNA-binding domain-containing protein [Clostridiales bacterium]|jgi:stage V sporulation protein T|nr:AbrB/MazE/SpoVT family DNA-binding domain-containing protein [Clostridiales bacterium]
MKNTGIVRRIDELGRIVIPMEYRKMHRINIGDPMEILATEKGEIMLKKIGLESEYINNASIVIDSMFEPFAILASDGLRWRVGAGPYKDKYIDKVINQKAVSSIATKKVIIDKDENGLDILLQPVIGIDSYGVLMAISDNTFEDSQKQMMQMISNLIVRLTERF